MFFILYYIFTVVVLDGNFALSCGSEIYARTNSCYNERGSRTSYVRSSIPHYIRIWQLLFIIYNSAESHKNVFSSRIGLQICAEEGGLFSGTSFVTVVNITNDSKFLTLLSLIFDSGL